MSWFQRHLNWTWVFAYLIWIPLNYSDDAIPPIIGAIFLLVVSGWVIKQKGRSLWWVLLTIVFSPLWLSNKKKKLASSQEPIKAPLIQKARTGTGCFVQVIGGILLFGSGLTVFIWELYVLFNTFGAWTILIALLFAPITYLAAIFIVWFSTGVFPIIVLILWLVSWVGVGIAYIGSRISGEEYD